MKNNIIETITGAVVLTVATFFLFFAYNSSGYKNDFKDHYWAKFDRVDGLQAGSDVRLSGVKVGLINDITIDPKTFMAHISFSLNDSLKLPTDSLLEIISDGLLGGKYLAIVPGGEDEVLKPGSEIMYTQASVSLEAMIGQLIFSKQNDAKDKDKDTKKDSNQNNGRSLELQKSSVNSPSAAPTVSSSSTLETPTP